MLDLLLYFTTHEDEEVQNKAIIGLGIIQLHLTSDHVTLTLYFIFTNK